MKTVKNTSEQIINRAGYSILTLYAITTIHHVYGGIVDGDMKRLDIPLIALVPLLITEGALYRYRKSRSGAALTTFSIVAVAWFVIVHGILHGAYAHAYRDILYLAGVPANAVNKYYYPLNPTEHYPPDNLFFEITGVLEMVTAYFVALFTLRLVQNRQRADRQGAVHEQSTPASVISIKKALRR